MPNGIDDHLIRVVPRGDSFERYFLVDPSLYHQIRMALVGAGEYPPESDEERRHLNSLHSMIALRPDPSREMRFINHALETAMRGREIPPDEGNGLECDLTVYEFNTDAVS